MTCDCKCIYYDLNSLFSDVISCQSFKIECSYTNLILCFSSRTGRSKNTGLTILQHSKLQNSCPPPLSTEWAHYSSPSFQGAPAGFLLFPGGLRTTEWVISHLEAQTWAVWGCDLWLEGRWMLTVNLQAQLSPADSGNLCFIILT